LNGASHLFSVAIMRLNWIERVIERELQKKVAEGQQANRDIDKELNLKVPPEPMGDA